MNGPERKPITGYLWAGLAVLTCLSFSDGDCTHFSSGVHY